MLHPLLIPSIVGGVIFGFLCSRQAKKKNKNSLLWFQLGFLFGAVALIAFFLLGLKEKANSQKLVKEAATASASSNAEIPPPLEDKRNTTLDKREWYYLDKENKQVGPITFDLLKKEHSDNKILDKTLLWSLGMEDWKSFDQLSYLQMVVKTEATSSL